MGVMCVVRTEREDVDAKLSVLGVRRDAISAAVLRGEAARKSATVNHPVTSAGFLAWSDTTAALRMELLKDGWRRCRDGGLETVVSPDGRVAIAVSGGDSGTGIASAPPRTKNAKGACSIAAIEQNQIELTPDDPTEFDLDAMPAGCQTWFLLLFSSGESVRCELSLPVSVGEDRRVDRWSDRLILDPLMLEHVLSIDHVPPIVVDVFPRAQ